jgi:Peptidase family M23
MLQKSSRPRRPFLFLCGAALLAFLAVTITISGISGPSRAQRGERAERPRRVQIVWRSVARDVLSLLPQLAAPSASTKQRQSEAAKLLGEYTLKEGMLPLAHLNALVVGVYPGIVAVPVPVLAPVDTRRFVSEKLSAGQSQTQSRESLFAASIENMELLTGLSGYDAEVTVSSRALMDAGISQALKPDVSISGSALSLSGQTPGELVADMQDLLPGLRRSQGVQDVTYRFRKYGVPYFVNVNCTPGPSDANLLSCTQADALVRIVLRDLRILGGGPLAIKPRAAVAVTQPTRVSAAFTYFPPGNLLPGTSEKNLGGSMNSVVYGNNLVFPIKDAPTFANAQVFMHWGDCLGQKQGLPKQPGDQYERYKCKQNSKVLFFFEGYTENYSYPWRDNYCESRGVGSPEGCPAKMGHEGQDIRANRCVPDPVDDKRCAIDLFPVVAVGDGSALWKQPTNNLKLIADDGADKLYYIYLHMSPQALSDAGMQKGKFVTVKAGQMVGKVGNYDHTVAGGTSTHLHFEVRRTDSTPVSPYLTLIRAYERLIGAQGTEVTK